MTTKYHNKYIFLGSVFFLFISNASFAHADHFKTACTTPEAYLAISEYRIEEESRMLGKSTKIGSLGNCFPIKRGTVVRIGQRRAGLVCLLSAQWDGCRYIGHDFIKKALVTSIRGFQKQPDLKTYIFLGY